MILQRTLKHIIRVTSRHYQRPPSRKSWFFTKWWDKNWNPLLPNGNPNYINMFKLSLLITLLNLNVYELYRNKLAFEAGELTAADRIYDHVGIDLGFRSVSKGRKPKCELDPTEDSN